MKSPCLECTRVRDPQNCENKLCKEWQAWFIDRWEAMRANVRAQAEEAPITEVGIPLGGHRYASPHRIHEYLEQDPCDRCLYPKDHCRFPCPTRFAWAQKKCEVME